MNAKQRRTRLRKHIDVIVKAQGLARLRDKPAPDTMDLLKHLEAGGTVEDYSSPGSLFWDLVKDYGGTSSTPTAINILHSEV